MAKFSEVLTIVNGRNQKQVVCDDGKYPIYGSGGIMGYANDYICKAETVVIGRKGSINKPIFVETPFWNVDTAFGLCANSEKLNPKYLYYFCEKFDFEKLNTTVTIPSLTKSNLLNVEIPLPNLEKQKQIVELLDGVMSLIFLRKQQLSKFDELVKARFVEMFGDPVVNSKRWPVETIENHIDLLTGFPFDSSGYVSKGVNICGGLIIMPQKIDWSACKHWPQITGYEDYILRPNDIVIALDRPWISNGFKIAMVDREHLPALLIQRTARIRAVDINQHYLMQSLLLGRFDKHCNITGSLVPHISPKDIKSYSVMLPPIELQNQFAAFVERVNQQKQTVQQSLEKLELMKKALMQEYFG